MDLVKMFIFSLLIALVAMDSGIAIGVLILLLPATNLIMDPKRAFIFSLLMVLSAMDSGIGAIASMLLLPANGWIPYGDADIVLSSVWVLCGKYYTDQFLVIKVIQIWLFVIFIVFIRACKSVAKNLFKHFILVVLELLSVCFILCLAHSVGVPMELLLTVFTTGTTSISLQKVLCENGRPSYFINEAAWFVLGVIWSVYGLVNELSDIYFIMIPILIGGVLGLVILVNKIIKGRN